MYSEASYINELPERFDYKKLNKAKINQLNDKNKKPNDYGALGGLLQSFID